MPPTQRNPFQFGAGLPGLTPSAKPPPAPRPRAVPQKAVAAPSAKGVSGAVAAPSRSARAVSGSVRVPIPRAPVLVPGSNQPMPSTHPSSRPTLVPGSNQPMPLWPKAYVSHSPGVDAYTGQRTSTPQPWLGPPKPVYVVKPSSRLQQLEAQLPQFYRTNAGQTRINQIKSHIQAGTPTPKSWKIPQVVLDYIAASPVKPSDPIGQFLTGAATKIQAGERAVANQLFPTQGPQTLSLDGHQAVLQSPLQAAGIGGSIGPPARWALNQLTGVAAEAPASAYYTGRAITEAAQGQPALAKSLAGQEWNSLTTLKGWETNPLANALVVRGLGVGAGDVVAGLRDLESTRVGAKLPASVTALPRRVLGEPRDLARAPLKVKEGAEFPRAPYARAWLRRQEQKLGEKVLPPMGAGKGKIALSGSGYQRFVNGLMDRLHGIGYRITARDRAEIQAAHHDIITEQHPKPSQYQAAKEHARHPITGFVHPIMNGHEAINPIIQGVFRTPATLEHDLNLVVNRLEREKVDIANEAPGGQEHQRIEAAISQFKGLLNNKQFLEHPNDVWNAARKAAARLNAQQPHLTARGVVHPEAAARSPKTPFIYEHMGGRLGKTPEALTHDQAVTRLNELRDTRKTLTKGIKGTWMPKSWPDEIKLMVPKEAGAAATVSPSNQIGIRLTIERLDQQIAAQERLIKGYSFKDPISGQQIKVPGTIEHKGEVALLHPQTYTHAYGPKLEGQPHAEAGQTITNEQADKLMLENGMNPAERAYITHRPMSNEFSRFMGLGRFAKASAKRRTMASYEQGQNDFSYDAVVNQEHRGNFLIKRHDQRVNILRQIVLRKKASDPSFQTFRQAEHYANLPSFKAKHGIPAGVDLQVIRLTPEFATALQRETINRDLLRPSAEHEDIFAGPNIINRPFGEMAKAGEDAVANPDQAPRGQWVIAIKPAIRRLTELEQEGSNDWDRALGAVTQTFRRTVLPLSLRRLLGVPFETGQRMIAARAGPGAHQFAARQMAAAQRLADMSDDKFLKGGPQTELSAREVLDMQMALMRTGTVTGQAMYQQRFLPRDRFSAPFMNTWQRRAQTLRAFPGARQMLHGYLRVTDSMMHVINAAERYGTQAGYGRAVMERARTDLSVPLRELKKWDAKAHEDFLRGKMNTPAQHEFALALDRSMGRWQNQGPGVRKILRYAPFASWTMNAYKFLYGVLPMDHPVLTGLLAAAHTATAQQRAAVGLSGPFAGNQNEVEPGQESGIPLPGARILASAGHYSPSSAAGNPLSAWSDVLPVLQPGFQAAVGVDYLGRYPKNAQGRRVPPDVFTRLMMGVTGMLDALSGPYEPAKSIAKNITDPGRLFLGIEPRFQLNPPAKSTGGIGGGLGGGGIGSGGLGGGLTP